MATETIETKGRTTQEGRLELNVLIGIPNAEVKVRVEVQRPLAAGELDAKGWPKGYFEEVAGSMPWLERPAQGEFEARERLS